MRFRRGGFRRLPSKPHSFRHYVGGFLESSLIKAQQMRFRRGVFDQNPGFLGVFPGFFGVPDPFFPENPGKSGKIPEKSTFWGGVRGNF